MQAFPVLPEHLHVGAFMALTLEKLLPCQPHWITVYLSFNSCPEQQTIHMQWQIQTFR